MWPIAGNLKKRISLTYGKATSAASNIVAAVSHADRNNMQITNNII